MNETFRTFIDCGAPSLYNALSRKSGDKGIMGALFKDRKYDDYSYADTPEYKAYMDSYIQYLLDNQGRYDYFSNLDVINNPQLTYRHQKMLEEAGLKPIPVFHLGNNPKWLKKYVEKYDYIALGGLTPNPTSTLIPILDKLFKEYLLDSDGFPKVKLHGFACTSLPLMTRYPWYSVDSTTCRKLAIYGSIVIPNGSKRLHTIKVSTRDSKMEHLFRPREIESMQAKAASFGFDFHELGSQDIKRVVWNYLLFIEKIKENIPAWPWSMHTRKSKEQDYLAFYLAGVLSKKEEVLFWDIMKGHDYTKEAIGRLQSFFYKSSLDHILNIKNGDI